ncbi:MAG: AmmeMemoRadiSam system protein B [Deltaproteobacteria bacterium]|nr:MAG: AmmeMemoRadiSam system protein B [Deltaproteobacteria bacterium]
MIRRAYVAGQFYPGRSDTLLKELQLISPPREARVEAIGVISPHAGYMYSGRVAGAVWGSVSIPEKLIILCPNHTGMGKRCSLISSGKWEIPLGEIPVDSDLAKRILENSPLASEDPSAHAFEHSLEVQLPFIYFHRKDFTFVPIALKRLSLGECEALGKTIARVVTEVGQKVLIAASTDMSHYEPDAVAREKDRKAIDKILSLDPEGLYRTVEEYDISMCGYIPTTVLLFAARDLGAKEAKLVQYATSGDASGDYSQVVGYAGLYVK